MPYITLKCGVGCLYYNRHPDTGGSEYECISICTAYERNNPYYNPRLMEELKNKGFVFLRNERDRALYVRKKKSI
jgi:hypothetical protein